MLLTKPTAAKSEKSSSLPTTPILRQDILTHALAPAVAPEVAESLRTASMLTVLNAFDRKVERDFFIKVLANSLSLNETIRRLEVGWQIKGILGKPELNMQNVDNAIEFLHKKAEAHRKMVADCMDGMAQMPDAGTTIN